MIKLKPLIFLLAFPVIAQAGIKEAITDATKGAVQFTKEVSSGLTDGIKEGRSSTQSADGSVVVVVEEEFDKYIEVELLSVSADITTNKTIVELGFKNSHSKPVRIANLDAQGVMLTIDKKGYSNPLTSALGKLEITIPNEAAAKHTFTFKGDSSAVKQVRLWTKTYAVNAKG